MSLPVIFTPEAWDDLEEIEEYLSLRFSERNAQKYIQRILAACNGIGLAPHRGTKRDDVGPNVRAIPFERRVVILFEIRSNSVEILALFYGGRQDLVSAR